MSKKITTVYIEDNQIKMLVSTGQVVEKWAAAPLDSDMVNEGIITQEDAVAERLKNLASELGVPGVKVIAAVSGQNSIFRLINLPEVPKNILDEAIQSEATRVIPVPLEQVYLSRQQLETGVPHEFRFFLAAHPRNATDALIRTIHKAGLKTKLMDVAPLALARAVHLSRCVVANTWLSSIDIVIMVNRVPEVIRSFPVGAESLTDAERITVIAEEIARTITFYNSSHAEDALGDDVPLLVSGELAGKMDSWAELSGASGRPVQRLTSSFTTPEGMDASAFMVNLGLAQKGMVLDQGSIIDLNALPAEYLPRGVNWFNILAPAVGVILVGVLVYGWTYVQDIKKNNDTIQPQIDAVQLQITQAQAKLVGLRSQVTDADKAVTPVQSQAAAYAAVYTSLQDQREKASAFVRNAWLKLPPSNITLDAISWDGSTLGISGTANISQTNVFDYAAALRDTHLFDNVVVTEVIKELTTDTMVYVYRFNLTCY
jgi:type IV pilus assembly protein PilM